MRHKRTEIITEFAKVDFEGVQIDDAFEALDEFTQYETTFDKELSSYVEVWEHPAITADNEGRDVMGKDFFTLYELKPDLEPNTYRSAFKIVLGRIGDTQTLNID